ncbi:MAG: Holliday junction branch migration protein RuvA [Candidatus Absconditabacteria bacterium]
MFHLFSGSCSKIGAKTYIQNQFFGIEATYLGKQSDGLFYLYPYLDDNKKTIVYYAFDTAPQKAVFEDMLKISGVGPKTALHLVQLPVAEMQEAIRTLNVKFFQSVPGVGPKSAKKILLELKGNFAMEDVAQIDIDQKLYKDIVKSLKGIGYDTTRVGDLLRTYPEPLDKDHVGEIIKWLIGKL